MFIHLIVTLMNGWTRTTERSTHKTARIEETFHNMNALKDFQYHLHIYLKLLLHDHSFSLLRP